MGLPWLAVPTSRRAFGDPGTRRAGILAGTPAPGVHDKGRLSGDVAVHHSRHHCVVEVGTGGKLVFLVCGGLVGQHWVLQHIVAKVVYEVNLVRIRQGMTRFVAPCSSV
jgi:hypothetical protein